MKYTVTRPSLNDRAAPTFFEGAKEVVAASLIVGKIQVILNLNKQVVLKYQTVTLVRTPVDRVRFFALFGAVFSYPFAEYVWPLEELAKWEDAVKTILLEAAIALYLTLAPEQVQLFGKMERAFFSELIASYGIKGP